MTTSFYRRFAPLLLVAIACLTPLVISGAIDAFQSANNDVRQWLPRGFAESRQYDWFLETFGSEEMVVVSWPGCTVADARLDRVAAALAPESPASNGMFRLVRTGPQVLAELMGPPLNLSREEAVQRVQGSLIGPDGRTSALVARVSEAGAANRPAALEAIFAAAEREAGVSREELRLGGPTVDSVALDVESERSRLLLTGLSVLTALVLAWRCLRHVRLVAMVFVTAVLCAGVSLAIVHYSGGTMNLLLIMMPPLIYVLSISGAIHIANYYQEAMLEGDAADAPQRAVATAWWPCLLAAGTTAIGLGSLAVSDVIPVKMFGIYAAVGTVVSVAILFLFLPSAMQLWPIRPERRYEDDENVEPVETFASRCCVGVVGWVFDHHRAIVAVTLLVMLFCGIGLTQLNTTVKVMSFFSPDSRIIRDYAWLEKNLGPLVPVEVVVRFRGDSQMPMVERLELVRDVQQRMEELEMVGGTMSAATFAPVLPTGSGVAYMMERRVMEQKLRESEDRLADLHFLHREAGGDELWRVSARVEALNSLDYGRFIMRVREAVDPVIAAHESWGSEGEVALNIGEPEVAATYTGIMPLLYKAQRQLLNDLTSSFLSAFLLIGVAMILLLRGLTAGLISMLPNILPIVLIFGGMGWMGVLIGIGTMMTASLALGIAVDGTIHYLSWFRRGLQDGLTRREAIQMAYRHCSAAMLQTTLICGVGLLVFAFSSFLPTARFAWLMFALLVAALIGDLILLPALLAGWWGRFFELSPAVTTDDEVVAWPAWKRLFGRPAYEPVPASVQAPLE